MLAAAEASVAADQAWLSQTRAAIAHAQTALDDAFAALCARAPVGA